MATNGYLRKAIGSVETLLKVFMLDAIYPKNTNSSVLRVLNNLLQHAQIPK